MRSIIAGPITVNPETKEDPSREQLIVHVDPIISCEYVRCIIESRMGVLAEVVQKGKSQRDWKEVFDLGQTEYKKALRHIKLCKACQKVNREELQILSDSSRRLVLNYIRQSLGINLSMQDLFI